MHQPFKTVGKMFQVFEQDTIDILVPYEEGSEVIEKIRGMKGSEYCYYLLQELKDKLKQYSVSIYQRQMEALYGEGLLESCLDGRLYILNSKAYHEKYGVDDKVKQAVEDFIL